MIKEDTISHFTLELRTIIAILESSSFIPKYNMEDITYKQNSYNTGESSFYIPVVCFCASDVNLKEHTETYGNYGIAFSRDWAISNGLIPVMYIQESTKIVRKLQNLFNNYSSKYRKTVGNEKIKIKEEFDNLFILSLFMKRYEGYFYKIKRNKIFYNEREWRFIPNLEVDQVSYVENEVILKNKNEELKNNRLFFDICDIKYLYVKEYQKQNLIRELSTKDLLKFLIDRIKVIYH